jgi:2-hydroxy-5-methyl-1-naphthoate 7-hydroxylase
MSLMNLSYPCSQVDASGGSMEQCPILMDCTGQDIHAEAARLRAQGPVARVELPGGVLAWSITSFDIAKEVLLEDSLFLKEAKKHWPAFINGEIPPDWQMITWVVMENMLTRDGEDHRRMRSLISKAFTPRQVESTRPMIEKIVHTLLDALNATPQGEVVDLKNSFTYPLPAQLVCDMFGVPEDSREEMLRGGQVNVDTTITPEEAAANVEQWHDALGELVAVLRRKPGDDLTSLLIAAQYKDGSSLTDEELVGTLHVMLGAGSETLTNVLGHAIIGLLTHPDQRELVMSGQVGWDAVFDETMRIEAPVAQLPLRFAAKDVEIGGVTIAKGDPVLMGFAGVGRDPAVHGETADVFDITRPNKAHLSFGLGAHFCLGAPLAKLEASIALPALFERFPGLRLAVPPDEIEPLGSFLMNGPRTLPVYLS